MEKSEARQEFDRIADLLDAASGEDKKIGYMLLVGDETSDGGLMVKLAGNSSSEMAVRFIQTILTHNDLEDQRRVAALEVMKERTMPTEGHA